MNTWIDDPLANEDKIDAKLGRTGDYWIKIRRVDSKKKYWKIVPRPKALRMLMGIPSGMFNGTLQRLKHEYEVVE